MKCIRTTCSVWWEEKKNRNDDETLSKIRYIVVFETINARKNFQRICSVKMLNENDERNIAVKHTCIMPFRTWRMWKMRKKKFVTWSAYNGAITSKRQTNIKTQAFNLFICCLFFLALFMKNVSGRIYRFHSDTVINCPFYFFRPMNEVLPWNVKIDMINCSCLYPETI